MTEDAPPSEQLEALLRLQEAETSIRRLEKRLDELPEQAALDESLEKSESTNAAYEESRLDLDRLESEMRKVEGNLDLLQDRKQQEQTRMYSGDISNPKELQAIRAEIDNVTERIDQREDELLGFMERREELTTRLERLEQLRGQLESEQETLTEARDDAAKGILAELAEAKAVRDREREKIDDDVLERYEKSKARHGGVGVGEMDHGICTACRFELTPLEMSDLRDGSGLGTCPQCQRLIVAL